MGMMSWLLHPAVMQDEFSSVFALIGDVINSVADFIVVYYFIFYYVLPCLEEQKVKYLYIFEMFVNLIENYSVLHI
jgi:hypothetical protein